MNVKELKKAMVEQDVKQNDLAKALKTTKGNISRKMTGKSDFTLPQAQQLIKFLHLDKKQAYDIFFTQ